MVRGGRGSVVPRRTGGEGREFPHPTKMAGNPFGMSPRTRATIRVGTWGRKGKNTGKTTARGRAGAPSVRRRSKTGRPGGSTLKMRMTRKGKETNHGWTQRGRVATKRIGTQGDSQAGKQETQEHRKTSKWRACPARFLAYQYSLVKTCTKRWSWQIVVRMLDRLWPGAMIRGGGGKDGTAFTTNDSNGTNREGRGGQPRMGMGYKDGTAGSTTKLAKGAKGGKTKPATDGHGSGNRLTPRTPRTRRSL